MSLFPAPGFLARLWRQLILMQHPNYAAFKKHLIGVWSGK